MGGHFQFRWMLPVLLLIYCAFPFSARAGAAPDPHAQLRDILQRPLYSAWRSRELPESNPQAEVSSHTFDQWLRYVSKKIDDFWDWLFPHKDEKQAASTGWGMLPGFLYGVGWIIAIGGAAVIVILIIQILRSSQVVTSTAHILSRQQIQQAMETGDALALNSSEWLDEAHRLAADQNFRMVYRALYLALLSGLHSAGKIDHNPNRTNWTYVQNYRGPQTERDLFSNLTDLFDRIWYGHKNAGSENLPQLRQTVRILIGSGEQT